MSPSELEQNVNYEISLRWQAKTRRQSLTDRRFQERLADELRPKNLEGMINFIIDNTTLYRRCDISSLSFDRIWEIYEEVKKRCNS